MFGIPWLANIWVRRAILAVVVFVALMMVRQHYINVGNAQGRVDLAQQSAKDINQARVADRADTVQQLAELVRQGQEQNRQTLSALTLVSQLAAQRQQSVTRIQGMTAEQVAAEVKRQVGELAPEQTQRSLLACRSELSYCDQQRAADEAAVRSAQAETTNAAQRYDVLDGYTVGLEQKFVQLWNTKATKERSWACLKLWRCRRPQIELPNPAELRRPAGAKLEAYYVGESAEYSSAKGMHITKTSEDKP